MSVAARRFVLSGQSEVVALALELLHVHGDVLGVDERAADECEVWLAGGWPTVLAPPAGVVVRELPVTADLFAHTGCEHDAPVRVAADLLVRPPWVAAPPGFAGVELVVPRGGAFGSGEHASTRAALVALHSHWPCAAVDTFVDVGTGSGILALYGAVRGARHVLACDIDRDAARAAARLLPQACVVVGGPATLAGRADVVVANMTAQELLADLGAIAGLWGERGLLVLSGLRGPTQAAACASACAALSLPRATAAHAVDEFMALAFVR